MRKLCTALLALALLVFPASASAAEPPDRGTPFSEKSDIVTRDLLYDKASNKQFLSIQDRDGNVFYLVIDYDAPVNEEEDQFSTYFLNPVDASDLAALAQDEEEIPPTCSCTEKCVPGHINMDCPVCAANLSECLGEAPEPPQVPDEPEAEEPPEPEKDRPAVPAALLIVPPVLAAAVGFAAFRKLKKGKEKPVMNHPDDYDMPDDDAEWVREEEPGGDGDE